MDGKKQMGGGYIYPLRRSKRVFHVSQLQRKPPTHQQFMATLFSIRTLSELYTNEIVHFFNGNRQKTRFPKCQRPEDQFQQGISKSHVIGAAMSILGKFGQVPHLAYKQRRTWGLRKPTGCLFRYKGWLWQTIRGLSPISQVIWCERFPGLFDLVLPARSINSRCHFSKAHCHSHDRTRRGPMPPLDKQPEHPTYVARIFDLELRRHFAQTSLISRHRGQYPLHNSVDTLQWAQPQDFIRVDTKYLGYETTEGEHFTACGSFQCWQDANCQITSGRIPESWTIPGQRKHRIPTSIWDWNARVVARGAENTGCAAGTIPKLHGR